MNQGLKPRPSLRDAKSERGQTTLEIFSSFKLHPFMGGVF
ncbi:hypothetical protein GXM_09974 [Nostoc sphaeroides CCNUC1]|uniref:Uncharacterized protein n=1 Tax=Nostoc sphaeroides CCNUC1 TaxID=2653204 RepID=A0A5P8WAQ4_9NOSO|nr:hypothetical protein GXM_07362 [Nostoc sphaeroides CCNUC1]QFS52480.1 hypothetical protein GXM_09974 [Nostoc sphaeroides CCNUC1]